MVGYAKMVIYGKVCRIENNRFFIKRADGGYDSYNLNYYRFIDG
jgi:hypothetical protein